MRNYTYICNVFIVYTNMIIGIIYKYTSPSGKCYIGQTINEPLRRKMWFSSGRYTGGKSKIDRARKKYNPSNFIYEIILRNSYSSLGAATEDLNKWEVYYIEYYNSYHNGYNSTLGGDGSRGYIHSNEILKKISESTKGKKKCLSFGIKVSKRLKGKPKSTNHRKKLSESKLNSGYKIIQYLLSGEYIKTWDNIDVVSKTLGVSRESIAGCCRGKSKSAHSYIWRYEGSTIPVNRISRRKDAKVVLKIFNGEVLEIYNSVVDAAISVGANESNIAQCCRGKCKSIKGFNWKYKEDLL